jgi:aryl-alcohol dehydrogenase-like predicted oxidoreductase
MNLRTLGRTGLKVSEVGFGAWGISRVQWIGADDAESLRALHRAMELGVNFIDTALAYGDGHSERLVGRAVRGRRDRVFVATKVPPMNLAWPARRDVPVAEVFPGDYVTRSAERSLTNLGLETIDLLQLHVWTDEFAGAGDWLDAVGRLKQAGKVRFFGISLGEHTPDNGLAAVEAGIVDTVQVIYNVFDQSPEERLFPACARRGVGVLARVPLDEGGLTGGVTPETRFAADDFRGVYFAGDRKREVAERAGAICRDLGIAPAQLAETALRFVLSHPAVSTVIPGMRTARHVEANAALGDGRGLPAEAVARLRNHRWERNFYR